MDLIREDDKLLREVFNEHRNQQSRNRNVRDDDIADGMHFAGWIVLFLHVSLDR